MSDAQKKTIKNELDHNDDDDNGIGVEKSGNMCGESIKNEHNEKLLSVVWT